MAGGGPGSTQGGGAAAAEQQFCLKWNNHRSTILSVFDALLEEESLIDVTLWTGPDNPVVRAHRIVLSACSPYFRAMFRDRQANNKEPMIMLHNVDYDNLKALIEYMYKGEANVPQHMLSSFIRTAEMLQIRGLAEGASPPGGGGGSSSNNNKSFDNGPHHNRSGSGIMPDGSPSHHMPLFPGNHSTPIEHPAVAAAAAAAAAGRRGRPPADPAGSGILAARLAAAAAAGSPAPSMLDFNAAAMAAAAANGVMLPRHPPLPAMTPHPPPTKKSRKSNTPQQLNKAEKEAKAKARASPTKGASSASSSGAAAAAAAGAAAPLSLLSNNNYESEDGALKIDEDADIGKENSRPKQSPSRNKAGNKSVGDDDVVELDGSNGGVDSEEEEEEDAAMGEDGAGGGDEDIAEEEEMQAPQSAAAAAAEAAAAAVLEAHRRGGLLAGSGGLINPWTGEEMGSVINDEGNAGSPPAFPILDASLMASAAAASVAGGDASPPTAAAGGASGDPNATTPQKYSCARCGRSYLHQATLVRHQRYECGITASYPCTLCGRKFKRRDVLKGHMEKCVNKSAAIAAGNAAAAAAAAAASTSSSSAVPPPFSPAQLSSS